jgi:hypothetical protein
MAYYTDYGSRVTGHDVAGHRVIDALPPDTKVILWFEDQAFGQELEQVDFAPVDQEPFGWIPAGLGPAAQNFVVTVSDYYRLQRAALIADNRNAVLITTDAWPYFDGRHRLGAQELDALFGPDAQRDVLVITDVLEQHDAEIVQLDSVVRFLAERIPACDTFCGFTALNQGEFHQQLDQVVRGGAHLPPNRLAVCKQAGEPAIQGLLETVNAWLTRVGA